MNDLPNLTKDETGEIYSTELLALCTIIALNDFLIADMSFDETDHSTIIILFNEQKFKIKVSHAQ